ncbi:MAG TPA: aldo/keto reductase [Anaeromyxobacteraceae bacterium]|jgi:aryl-alcohol dehydrogenase (NADP+)|nr:aldo/keto reductase [Anaeromyxobacteraceae bacterium]
MTSAPHRRRLGATDLQVFPLNLGGNVFGWTADRAQSLAVLDAYRAAGGNFVDTADRYSGWVPGHRGGESEEVLGAWLRERGCRGEMVIATKVGAGGPEVAAGLSADQIRRGCEGSLRRLGTDRLDLYYAHKDDPSTPLEETLAAFDALVREGKVRCLGASNYAAPRLREALDASERGGLAAYAVVQPEYSLVARTSFEGELSALCAERGLGVCTYYALASGFLTGKYGEGPAPATPRAAAVKAYLADPVAMARLATAREVARERGATVAQVALAWQLHHPPVTAPIASATSPAQVEELCGAVGLALSPEEVARLDRAGA